MPQAKEERNIKGNICMHNGDACFADTPFFIIAKPTGAAAL